LPIPDIHECCPHLPAGVQTIMERALAKDPADRYQRAGELAAALRAVADAAAAEKPSEPEPSARESTPSGLPTLEDTPSAPPEPLPTLEDTPSAPPEPLPTLEDTPSAPPEPPPAAQEESPAQPASVAQPSSAAEPAPSRRRRGPPAWVWIGAAVAAVALLVCGLALAGVFGGRAAAPPAPEPTEREITEEPTEEEPAEEEMAEEPAEEEPATEEPATEEPATSPPTERPTERPTEQPTEPPTEEPTLSQSQQRQMLAETGVNRNADWTPYIEEMGGAEMALVPAGCFSMGSTGGDNDEAPVHRVCFDEPFWIDVYEVTNEQYGSTGCWSSGAGYPRDCVNWADASSHCRARGARLPTEAEWEYAARGPDGLVYPWGNDLTGSNLVYRENSDGHAAAVGSRPGGASWVGAYDLSGNLWEWVADWYDASYYSTLPEGAVNPQGPGSGPARLLRGGGWDNNMSNARAANRVVQLAVNATDYAGFRCARSY
jgi:formylglycine-generating enzyme required for sulfatase activity